MLLKLCVAQLPFIDTMSFALKKQIKKELLSSDWCGKVEEAAVAALATLIDERHGGQLDVLPDILKACTSGRGAGMILRVQKLRETA